jgi:hypothetical protein
MEAGTALAITAGVASTFIGFTGVIFAVGRSSRDGWNAAERTALLNLLMPSVVVLFLSLIPIVALTGVQSQALIWRGSNGLLAVIHLALVTSALIAALKSTLMEPVPLRFVLIPGGYASGILSALVALGFLPQYMVMIFVAGLVWSLLVATVQFVMLILPRPVAEHHG